MSFLSNDTHSNIPATLSAIHNGVNSFFCVQKERLVGSGFVTDVLQRDELGTKL